MVKEYIYWKKNVNYNVGVRMFSGDKDGVLLSGASPIVTVDAENARDFKLANKLAITSGLIVPSEEPTVDWETANAVTDEEIGSLVKNYLQLKQRLTKIDSISILYKLLEEAKSQDRAKRIISMIQARIDEIEEEDTFSSDPNEMQGVE